MSSSEGKAPRRRPFLGLWKKASSPPPAPAHHLLHDVSGDLYFKVPLLRPVKAAGGENSQYARVGSIYVQFHGGAPVRQVELHVEKDPRCLVADGRNKLIATPLGDLLQFRGLRITRAEFDMAWHSVPLRAHTALTTPKSARTVDRSVAAPSSPTTTLSDLSLSEVSMSSGDSLASPSTAKLRQSQLSPFV